MLRNALLVIAMVAGTAAAAELPPDMQFAAKALREFDRVCEPEGTRLWRKSLCGPMILVNPFTRAALANRPDPDGKFQKTGDLYTGEFPQQFTPSNTAIQWGGQAWATVMLPVPADLFQRLSLLTHESFHRIQDSIGLRGSDTPNPHMDTEAGRVWLRLELRALARALRATGDGGRQSAADAMLFRMNRHRLCPGSAEMEAALEKQEGLAEYTGVSIALRATGENVSRVARVVEAFEDSSAMARSYGYATGPGLGLLLDRYAAGWRERAATVALDSMLATALHVKDSPNEAQQRAAGYGYAAVAAAEREREERHQTLLAELTRRFLNGPTLDFPSSPEMNRNFNPSNLVPFPPNGTYYPTGTFSAKWGKLRVDSGALVAPDNQSVRVSPPADPNARPVRGNGWELELEPGWTIRPAERPGAFKVVPAEQK